MSHFTVMVFGTDVEKQLQPFHEYECTGIKDEYVVWVDCTDEVLEEFNNSVAHQQEYGDLTSFARDYHGYDESEDKPGRFGRWTNPNAKWDWWVIGGRWSGFLKLKPGAKGKHGERSWANPGADEMDRADQARKGDIDVAGVRDEAGEKAGKKWDIINPVVGPHEMTFMPWELAQEMSMRGGEVDDELARKTYHGQDVRKAIEAAAEDKENPHREMFLWLDALESYFRPREEFVQSARDAAITTFAVLQDGQWVERGEMGWWGCVSNEKDPADWKRQFNTMFDALPDDTLITIVDCHI